MHIHRSIHTEFSYQGSTVFIIYTLSIKIIELYTELQKKRNVFKALYFLKFVIKWNLNVQLLEQICALLLQFELENVQKRSLKFDIRRKT